MNQTNKDVVIKKMYDNQTISVTGHDGNTFSFKAIFAHCEFKVPGSTCWEETERSLAAAFSHRFEGSKPPGVTHSASQRSSDFGSRHGHRFPLGLQRAERCQWLCHITRPLHTSVAQIKRKRKEKEEGGEGWGMGREWRQTRKSCFYPVQMDVKT